MLDVVIQSQVRTPWHLRVLSPGQTLLPAQANSSQVFNLELGILWPPLGSSWLELGGPFGQGFRRWRLSYRRSQCVDEVDVGETTVNRWDMQLPRDAGYKHSPPILNKVFIPLLLLCAVLGAELLSRSSLQVQRWPVRATTRCYHGTRIDQTFLFSPKHHSDSKPRQTTDLWDTLLELIRICTKGFHNFRARSEHGHGCLSTEITWKIIAVCSVQRHHPKQIILESQYYMTGEGLKFQKWLVRFLSGAKILDFRITLYCFHSPLWEATQERGRGHAQKGLHWTSGHASSTLGDRWAKNYGLVKWKN